MKSTILVFLSLFACISLSQGQSDYCGTIANEKTLSEIFLKSSKFNQDLSIIRDADITRVRQIIDIKRINDVSQNFDTEAAIREVAIHAIILRRTNASGGITTSNIESNINRLV